MHHCASACPAALETGAAASAPVSAAGRVSAACWAPQKRLTVWRKTTCSLPVRQEGDPVDLREDAALPQDSAVMQRAALLTNPASPKKREMNRTARLRAATPVTSYSGSCNWPATLLLTGSTNELLLTPRAHQNLSMWGQNGTCNCVSMFVILIFDLSPGVLLWSAFVNIFFCMKIEIDPDIGHPDMCMLK